MNFIESQQKLFQEDFQNYDISSFGSTKKLSEDKNISIKCDDILTIESIQQCIGNDELISNINSFIELIYLKIRKACIINSRLKTYIDAIHRLFNNLNSNVNEQRKKPCPSLNVILFESIDNIINTHSDDIPELISDVNKIKNQVSGKSVSLTYAINEVCQSIKQEIIDKKHADEVKESKIILKQQIRGLEARIKEFVDGIKKYSLSNIDGFNNSQKEFKELDVTISVFINDIDEFLKNLSSNCLETQQNFEEDLHAKIKGIVVSSEIDDYKTHSLDYTIHVNQRLDYLVQDYEDYIKYLNGKIVSHEEQIQSLQMRVSNNEEEKNKDEETLREILDEYNHLVEDYYEKKEYSKKGIESALTPLLGRINISSINTKNILELLIQLSIRTINTDSNIPDDTHSIVKIANTNLQLIEIQSVCKINYDKLYNSIIVSVYELIKSFLLKINFDVNTNDPNNIENEEDFFREINGMNTRIGKEINNANANKKSESISVDLSNFVSTFMYLNKPDNLVGKFPLLKEDNNPLIFLKTAIDGITLQRTNDNEEHYRELINIIIRGNALVTRLDIKTDVYAHETKQVITSMLRQMIDYNNRYVISIEEMLRSVTSTRRIVYNTDSSPDKRSTPFENLNEKIIHHRTLTEGMSEYLKTVKPITDLVDKLGINIGDLETPSQENTTQNGIYVQGFDLEYYLKILRKVDTFVKEMKDISTRITTSNDKLEEDYPTSKMSYTFQYSKIIDENPCPSIKHKLKYTIKILNIALYHVYRKDLVTDFISSLHDTGSSIYKKIHTKFTSNPFYSSFVDKILNSTQLDYGKEKIDNILKLIPYSIKKKCVTDTAKPFIPIKSCDHELSEEDIKTFLNDIKKGEITVAAEEEKSVAAEQVKPVAAEQVTTTAAEEKPGAGQGKGKNEAVKKRKKKVIGGASTTDQTPLSTVYKTQMKDMFASLYEIWGQTYINKKIYDEHNNEVYKKDFEVSFEELKTGYLKILGDSNFKTEYYDEFKINTSQYIDPSFPYVYCKGDTSKIQQYIQGLAPFIQSNNIPGLKSQIYKIVVETATLLSKVKCCRNDAFLNYLRKEYVKNPENVVEAAGYILDKYYQSLVNLNMFTKSSDFQIKKDVDIIPPLAATGAGAAAEDHYLVYNTIAQPIISTIYDTIIQKTSNYTGYKQHLLLQFDKFVKNDIENRKMDYQEYNSPSTDFSITPLLKGGDYESSKWSNEKIEGFFKNTLSNDDMNGGEITYSLEPNNLQEENIGGKCRKIINNWIPLEVAPKYPTLRKTPPNFKNGITHRKTHRNNIR